MDNNSDLRFHGKTVVITGSGTGIGQAIAKKFAENGASIIILGRRKEPLEETEKVLNSIMVECNSQGRVRSFPGIDVSDEKGINQMYESIEKEFGHVDIVINNAGVSGPVKCFTNANFMEFKDCVNIHLTGTFWTSLRALSLMQENSIILTISTFFTEENRYEQRPYRFRTPYTAAQGAKNRLAEALAWELKDKKIRSIATNPGPVHSDRIYKTVYPKAAAEFLRVGGFENFTSKEIETATSRLLPLLGEDNTIIEEGITNLSLEISKGEDNENIKEGLRRLMNKLTEIAQKIQDNTKNMIVDGEFLTQEDVAEMALKLCNEKISKLINGRIIPNDRVFYPVRPIIATPCYADISNNQDKLHNKLIVITANNPDEKCQRQINEIGNYFKKLGAREVIVLTNDSDPSAFSNFHSHNINFDQDLSKVLKTATSRFGNIDAFIHFTGDYDYNKSLTELERKDWDGLVNNFINIPAFVTKEAVNNLVPNGFNDPSAFKESRGKIIIVGPSYPVGKKVSGTLRARAEVMRGALRPYVTTANQELRDVLGSKIRLYLLLGGGIAGQESSTTNLINSICSLMLNENSQNIEQILYIDELLN